MFTATNFRLATLAFATLVLMAPASHAITINLTPAGTGNVITGTGKVATDAPATVVGGGTLDQAFQTAKYYWESAILDTFTLNITYGWGDTGNANTLAFEQTSLYAGTPSRITNAGIVVKSQGSPGWFADPTPDKNNEWTASSTDFAGAAVCNGAAGCVGILTTGISYSGATDPNVINNTDLLSVVIHEMGHALGLDVGYAAYQAEAGVDKTVDLTGPRPFPGAKIYVLGAGSAHLDPAQGNEINSLMQPTIGTGVRRLPSGADILADCQVSSFVNCGLTASIPEPMPTELLATSAIALFFLRRRLARR